MASTRPVSWPPDRGFRREPPISPENENISMFEKIIRYAEKDDLLLYFTALFGVLMPAVMYFVYKAAHSKYHEWAKKRRAERRRERAKQRAITLFYMPVSAQLKRTAYNLAEQLESMDPVVASLVPDNLAMFRCYKGIMIFLFPDVDPKHLLEEMGGWFLDWLQEMKFEARQKDLLESVKFCTLGINTEETEPNGKLSNLLTKRLVGLQATQLQPPRFIMRDDKLDADALLTEQAELLMDAIKESWEGYDSDDTNLLSTEEDLSEIELAEELAEMEEMEDECESKKDK